MSDVQAHSLPSTSEMPCRQIFENIRQEYSTLAFLMGGKTFPDEELVLANKSNEGRYTSLLNTVCGT